MGEEKHFTWYDKLYETSCKYKVHYKNSPYYPLWSTVLGIVKGRRHWSVLDLGCGTAQLGSLLLDSGVQKYSGVDFSHVAVSQAEARDPRLKGALMVKDVMAFLEEFGAFAPPCIVLTEFLEHVANDKEVLRGIPPTRMVVFTVPNHDSESHVRWFDNYCQVEDRYGNCLSSLEVFPFGRYFVGWGLK